MLAADDVSGFENQGGSLTGGIQVTGNYPGRARTIDELRRDVLKAKSYIPGNHRLSLHEIYGDFQGEKVDRDEVEPHHFESWIQWAKENDFKLDFNSTSFSHPKSGDLTWLTPAMISVTSGSSIRSVVAGSAMRWVKPERSLHDEPLDT